MSDYISRDELLEAVLELPPKMDEQGYGWLGRRGVWQMINDFPAANVQEVKTGRWVKAKGSWFTPGGDPVWECSECGKGMHVYGIEHGTYGSDVADGQWVSCPNCGAKMEVDK